MRLLFGKWQGSALKLPKALMDYMGYSIYFWSNEGNEPIHVHVSKGNPIENATKFFIRRDELELAHNKSKIPAHDLKVIQKYIWANRNEIIARWVQYFSL
jgi:hypothetical protein